jgi:molybdopterin-biosynthesis enzyme MoeA-like protein
VSSLIVRVLRIAAEAVDLMFVCGGLGFTPDDITRKAVATAFFRDVQVDRHLAYRFRRDNAWADEQIATAAATFPVDATPLETATGGVPGFRLRNAYVLPGMPAEMRAMFRGLTLPVGRDPIHRAAILVDTTEDRITETLEQAPLKLFGRRLPERGPFSVVHAPPPPVRLRCLTAFPRPRPATGCGTWSPRRHAHRVPGRRAGSAVGPALLGHVALGHLGSVDEAGVARDGNSEDL